MMITSQNRRFSPFICSLLLQSAVAGCCHRADGYQPFNPLKYKFRPKSPENPQKSVFPADSERSGRSMQPHSRKRPPTRGLIPTRGCLLPRRASRPTRGDVGLRFVFEASAPP